MKKILSVLAIISFIFILPWIIWQFQGSTTLDVGILDKTVPTENYREHHGLTWILNHGKYEQEDGSIYRKETDYYGFHSDEEQDSYEVTEISSSKASYDLLYVADTYGVYEEDLSWTEGTMGDSAPELVYGGTTMEDWESITSHVDRGADMVVEFNAFSSPTAPEVREEMTEYLGLEWTGWSGRYFGKLELESDLVPDWIVARYEQSGNTWQFEGEGFVLVHDLEEKIVVLSEEQGDVGSLGIRLVFNETGNERFELTGSPAFHYWFDINLPTDASTTLADYDWDLTDQGAAALEENGIPRSFPAIVHSQKAAADVYYFAGDFVDISKMPAVHQYSGYANVLSWLSSLIPDSETAFYWKTYVPVMQHILEQAEEKRNTATEKSPQATYEDLHYPSRVAGNDFEIYRDGEWEKVKIKGVNMGMAKPGTFPGEAAITKDEYERWFQQISDMNANSFRVYTLHPPGFYRALERFNATAEEPLYLFHGVWIEEEPLAEELDAFHEPTMQAFQDEMRRLADVIHGNAVVEQRPGHAYGTYTADISPYVIGWILGVEWYPFMVDEMERLYPDLGDYDGEYVFSEGATPMEHWVALQMDLIAAYEVDNYNSMRPTSFTNWVTTDNLDHPAEPSDQEDLAIVDPNHIKLKGALREAGMFASYHVYPYYPDFLNLEPGYTEFIDHRGERNNYAGYLRDLNESHDLPLLIAEFGVPGSRGKTHENPFGWNQGFISETEQGDIAVRLYEDMMAEDMLGGLVFTWQDEWFKRTWNTMDYDNPDRRPFWSNAQTNEQQFGVLSFDRHKVKVNGVDDWEAGEELLEKQDGNIQSIMMDHDERYLYVKAQFAKDARDWWDEQRFNLYFSLRNDAGVEVATGPDTTGRADFHLAIRNKEDARLLVAGDYDTFYYDYVERLELMEPSKEVIEDVFHPIRLALNKEIVRPDTGEILPFSFYETGVMQFGIADPASESYDSLNDWFYSPETGVLEIRIPWMLLNAKDPSQLEFVGNLQEGGLEDAITVENIRIAATMTDDDGQLTDSFANTAAYSWEQWDLPEHEERLKQSYYILQDFFKDIQ
ncbi:hypothetical protein [Planomicrobium sp. YIM 101495]|uniref:hypothetical protein n=1 Tax=Planomicrobium sp. YIM 101495 TaxID=2665160 RepID=UPI00351A1397